MVQSQLDEIKDKIEKKMSNFRNGDETVTDSDCYTQVEKKPIWDKINAYVDKLEESFNNDFTHIHTWYESHEDTQPSPTECELGKQYLESVSVRKTLICWFIESYGEEPPYEYTQKRGRDISFSDITGPNGPQK